MASSILLVDPKHARNVGSAVRAVSCYGGGHVFFTGNRVDLNERLPREERMKGYADAPWTQIPQPRPVDWIQARGTPLTPVAIELLPGSEMLHTFEHPENALYIFGPEDGSIPSGLRTVCHRFVAIPSFHCLNMAAAVYVTLYDRMIKRVAAGIESLPSIDGEGRGVWHTPLEEQ